MAKPEGIRILDLTITHAKPAAGALTTEELIGSAGAAAQEAHERKLEFYNKHWVIPGGEFVPMAMETGGRFHPTARRFFKLYTRSYTSQEADTSLWTPKEWVKYNRALIDILVTVSVSLRRAVTRSLLYLAAEVAGAQAPGAAAA